MSVESLVFLAIFVLLPLIERLIRGPRDGADAPDAPPPGAPRPAPRRRQRPAGQVPVPGPNPMPAPPMPVPRSAPMPAPRPAPMPAPKPVPMPVPAPVASSHTTKPGSIDTEVAVPKYRRSAGPIESRPLPSGPTRRGARRRSVMRVLRAPYALRSAVLLTTILGPCRAIEPYDGDARRDR